VAAEQVFLVLDELLGGVQAVEDGRAAMFLHEEGEELLGGEGNGEIWVCGAVHG
jgi:hypothetical protein